MRLPWRRQRPPRRVLLRVVAPPGDVIMGPIDLDALGTVVRFGYPEADGQWWDLVQLPQDCRGWLTCRLEVMAEPPAAPPTRRRRHGT